MEKDFEKTVSETSEKSTAEHEDASAGEKIFVYIVFNDNSVRTGQNYWVTNTGWAVEGLRKSILEFKKGYSEKRLYHDGELMQDGHTLREYGVKENALIVCDLIS